MDFLKKLNDEQREAVTHDEGPLLIVAGAGTGKTTVITNRVAWLIESKKAKADEVLALTFTEKAAAEMEERIDKLLPYGYTELWTQTFHAFAERILKQHALDIGVPHDFRLLTQTEQWLLIRRNLDRFSLNYYRPLGNPTRFIHALVTHFSRLKDEEITPEQYVAHAESLHLDADTEIAGKAKRKKRTAKKDATSDTGEDEAARIAEVANAYHVYQQLLLENNALDFGDLITYALKLFRTRPEILEAYRQQFRYVVVDEFQDTNWAQYELVKLLAAPTNNLTVVGDDDQSIYRFRGASMSNILQFEKDFSDAARVALTTNYRSAQNILDLAHGFIKHNNPNRLEAALAKTDHPLDKALVAANDTAGDITHLHGATVDDEYGLIIRAIVARREKGGASWGDFAILARTNNQASDVAAALDRAGLPYQSYTSRGLYRTSIVVDVISFLGVLHDPYDSVRLWRLLNFPFWKITPESLLALSHAASKKGASLYEALTSTDALASLAADDRAACQRVVDHLAGFQVFARDHRPTEVLVKVLNESGYTAWVEGEGDEFARFSFNLLNQLYSRVKQFEESEADPRLRSFMEALTFELDSGEAGELAVDPELGPDVIRVMTVHTAKGLEFPHVFVVGLVDRRFPTIERRDPILIPDALIKEQLPTGEVHLEEERRLFYVAITRAKESITFTSADDYGGVRKKKPSRFLEELDIVLSEPVALGARAAFSTPTSEQVPNEVAATHAPTHLSYTALKAFEECPYRYRYAHVLKVPTWGRHTFSFGKSLHLALERFFAALIAGTEGNQADLFSASAKGAERTVPSLDELLTFFEVAWIDEWYPSRQLHDEYKARGREILRDFYKKHDGSWPNAEAVEKSFALKVGEYVVRGQADRVDKTDDGIAIVDYKTGRVPQRDSEVDKRQLYIYQLAAQEVWGEKPTTLTFYYLDGQKEVSFLGSEEDLTKMKENIAATMEAIHRGEFAPTPSPQVCSRCDFKDICPFSQA